MKNREMNKISVPPTDNSGWQVVHVVQRTNNKGGRWCSQGKSCVVRGGQVLLSVPPPLLLQVYGRIALSPSIRSSLPPRVILKTVPKNLTLVKLDERVRRPSQRSNVLLKIIRIIYLTYMCVTCVNHVTHSSNVLDQILVRRLWRYKNIWALPLSLFLSTNALLFITKNI